MPKSSRGLPWPRCSADESTAAQWSKNLFADTGQQCHVERKGHLLRTSGGAENELGGWMEGKKAVNALTEQTG